MLSRVADTIYWMARYVERTSGMLQVLRTTYISSQDVIKDFSWRPLLNTYAPELTTEELKEVEWDTTKVFEHLILGRENISSAYNNIRQARENARAIQDHIPKEVWQTLNNYYHFIRDREFENQVRTGDPVTAIDGLIRNGLLFTGTIKNTMTRDEGYTYLHIGKFLERSLISADVLRIKLSGMYSELKQAEEARNLRYLLYSLFGYEIYMKTYKGNFNTQHVLELIVYNPFFPHSILYGLNQVNRYFERLQPESLPESYAQLEFLIGKTKNNVKYSALPADQSNILNQFLLQTRADLIAIGSSFSKYYFGNT
ncbi:MAG: alpha-E domain-containing protein [Segetibacter sp.]